MKILQFTHQYVTFIEITVKVRVFTRSIKQMRKCTVMTMQSVKLIVIFYQQEIVIIRKHRDRHGHMKAGPCMKTWTWYIAAVMTF